MDRDAAVYTVRLWQQQGRWRIAVRAVGQDRLHLFDGVDGLYAFFALLTAGDRRAAKLPPDEFNALPCPSPKPPFSKP